MSVYNRKLFFNRGGQVNARGTGITSGLVPVQKFKEGGMSKWEALSPFLLDVGGRLMGGTSMTGNFGEIAGGAVAGAAPTLSEGLKTYRESQKTDDEKYDFKVVGKKLVKINKITGETETVEEYEDIDPIIKTVKAGETLVSYDPETNVATKIFDKVKMPANQKLIKLGQNQILIDPITKQEVARGIEKQDTEVYKLNPGQKIFDKNNKVIAYYEKPDDDIITLQPGEKAFDKAGNLLFESPAAEKEPKIFKLSQGQKAFTKVNGELVEIASVAAKKAKPIDTTITIPAGSKVINKETGELIFDNPSKESQQKLYKSQPGTILIDEAGKVIYKAPEKKEYFKLKEGESIYDEQGNVIATGTSTIDNMDKYNEFKTESERYNFVVKTLAKKAGYDDNGQIILDNLDFAEQQEYKLALEQVSTSYRADLENWGETQKDFQQTISTIYNMDYQLDQVEAALNDEEGLAATGPITGRVTPLFGVIENLTGINLATAINKTFGKNIILENLKGDEMSRLQSVLSLQFQEKMKGQVSNYEAKQIVKSMFSTSKLPGSNELALSNMRFINDMNMEMIRVAQISDTYDEFAQKMGEWKKNNKPSVLETPLEKKEKINDKYGLDLYPEGENSGG